MTYDSAEAAARACSIDGPVVDVIQGKAFERLEVAGCPICGKWYSAKRLKAGYGMTAVVAECRGCRIAYQALRPSPEATLAYMNWRWASSDAYVADIQGKISEARWQLELVRKQSRPRALLDFGAGSGAFVRVALDEGYNAVGVERSDIAIANAKERYHVDLQRDSSGEYDVVTLWDVVEHLRDPVETLSMLRSRMRSDGMILLATGNWQSLQRIVNRDRWGLILFDHQYYFTPRSLEKVLSESGFSRFRLLNASRTRPWLSAEWWMHSLIPASRRSMMVACAVAQH